MNREEKARLYDEYVRESDRLQREISKIKAEHIFDIPMDKQEIINKNNAMIEVLVKNLERLYMD